MGFCRMQLLLLTFCDFLSQLEQVDNGFVVWRNPMTCELCA